MLKRLLAATIALLTSSCAVTGREPALVWHVDERFSDDERTCIEDAADQWRTHTKGLVNYTFEYDYDPMSTRDRLKHRLNHRIVMWKEGEEDLAKADRSVQERDKSPDSRIYGRTNGVDITQKFARTMEIALVPTRIFPDKNLCEVVMAHEFGHTLGIDHLNHKYALMYAHADYRATACPKKADMNAFCALNNCEDHNVTWCEDGTY